jgi:hypothetical protein
MADSPDRDDELETCCICLDSLSSSPVVALLHQSAAGSSSGSERSCAHFFHAACAERLAPQNCPMCRTPFEALSAPFCGNDLVAAGAEIVIAGVRRLRGETPSVPTVAARTVVELLAASFPIKQTSLEAAVADLAEAPHSPGWVVSSPRSGMKHIGAPGLVQLLGRCSTVRLELNRRRHLVRGSPPARKDIRSTLRSAATRLRHGCRAGCGGSR